ncbi:nitroreductase family protein [Dysgonomonas sp. Marseille-P4677]|uniref:nitroreductase family protein n=1 Tax=Dysgonomonas sp. Marseille-P4677 TaxID=2364790 RepID=UPI001912F2C1|nr:nitroreductase family protein [Dysgonomonas sp. Marseille-P4677]MBK5721184.1 nitroreductase family protein [Dysgonomonas sp. Marseille-P4677]
MQLKKVKNQKNTLFTDRVSIRQYDKSVKISREEMTNILQDAMTAPSSFNLQPWRFFIFDTNEGKELIKPFMMFNQMQWETSSALIAIYGDMDNYSSADKVLSANVEFNLITQEYKDKMLEMMTSYGASYTEDRLKNSIFLDCGFIIMQLMLSAKNYGYDTNPIGGFMRKELTETLKLDPQRYIPILLLSIGKASEQAKESVRFSVEDITQWR